MAYTTNYWQVQSTVDCQTLDYLVRYKAWTNKNELYYRSTNVADL